MKRLYINIVFIFLWMLSASHTGIDVSHHQGRIDWKEVSKDSKGIEFVYVKASEGATMKDKCFKYNMQEARECGMKVGAYHYFRMTSSAHAQFVNFKQQLCSVEFDLIPMVDVETSDSKSVKELQDSLDVFIALVKKEYGVSPMIYGTNRSYNTYCAPKYNNLYLYIGRYGKHAPEIIGTGKYTVWQYSEEGKVLGIGKNVDLCKFRDKKDYDRIQYSK